MRDYLLYIKDILDAMNLVEEFLDDMPYDIFIADKKTISAVRDQLVIIGEGIKNIPDSVKLHYPEIPWKEIAGMRDILTHAYFRTDLELLYTTGKISIPALKPAFLKMYQSNSQQ
jgi:uncharacterized protein with HEPN domain